MALNFLATIFCLHPSKQRLSFSRYWPRSSSVWALYVALSSLYANVYGLSLPIRPFQGPLYTVTA